MRETSELSHATREHPRGCKVSRRCVQSGTVRQGAHCLHSTHGHISADGASALRRLPAVRIATRLHHAGAGRHAVLFLPDVRVWVEHTSSAVDPCCGRIMRRRGSITVGVLGLILYGSSAMAQDFGRYREFELGSAVAAVSTVTGVAGSELKAIHQRPAVIQELTWRPRYSAYRAAAPDTDSVDRMVFDFYDDRLFRVTVDYDRKQTEGLTDADMIEAIAQVY